MRYTTEQLVTSVQRRTLAPNSQPTYQTAETLAFLNEELQLTLAADLMAVREDFFLRKKRLPLIASVRTYGIPERATGNALKKVFYITASGDRYALRRYGMEAFEGDTELVAEPSGFIMYGDELMLDADPSRSEGYLELWYFARPSELVQVADVAKIEATATDGANTVFTVDTDLTSGLVTGSLVDVMCSKSPFLLWAEDATVVSITTSTITIATSSLTNEAGTLLPQAGDYICPAQKSHIPQIPQELHPLLAQMAGCRILEGLGDIQKLQVAEATRDRMRKQAFTLTSNRVESELEPIINRQGILDYASGSDWF